MTIRGTLIEVSVLAVMLLSVNTAAGGPAVFVDAAREFVEGVLGPGTVRSIRMTEDGRQILVRWESPTFAKTRTVEDARQMIYGEAVLATGAIFGHLPGVNRVRFTVLFVEQMLATGEHVRGQGVRLTFVPQLGGPYAPVAPATDPKRRPAGGATQEI